MRSNFLQLFAAFVTITFVFLGSSYGQQKDDALSAAAGDRYVISVKAGHINYVEGSVSVVRKEGKSGLLLKGDRLQIGDRVSTGVDGKIEILLNPGSFLRLGALTTFEFETTDLDDLQLRLGGGSAILEVFATDEFIVSVKTPKTNYKIIATGIYRIDVPERGDTRLEVWKGLAQVGDEMVKGGRAATTGADGRATVAKFDRDEKDALDTWSKTRGKELTRMTASMRRVDLGPRLMNTWGTEWNMFGSFGLWIFNPFYGGYVFLPFGHAWNSPYGYGYNNCIHYHSVSPVVFNPPILLQNTGGGPIQTPTPTPAATTPIATAANRSIVPPFVRMEQSLGGGGRGIVDGGSGSGSSSPYDASHGSSSHSSSSSTRDSSPPKSDPAPVRSDPAPSTTRDSSPSKKP